ncbi:serine O-acetyltransferase EpsC [Fimbriiglobus ruber]|uniref:Serine acetyltransferase n=1 Tax=Fimbriiglobus ruber TaxID=1908690 RepID=A0A225DHS6_9BACT|nr:serine O-acetyltransferase EpsC [Fimbriiglobus ruber]OWK38088.1 Serine acetyltransferase [Fimbriiglobus ruber]
MATDIRLKETELQSVTDQLVESYSTCGRLHHLGHEPLPNREAVADILADLYEVIYPGYGRRQNLNTSNITYYVGSLVDALHDKLTQQITRALRHDRCHEEPDNDCEAEGQQVAVTFLQRLAGVRQVLEVDVEAAYRGDPAAKSHHEIVFSYPGLEAITAYRLAHELSDLKVPYIPRMMTEIAHSKTGIDIHPGATIGPGFFIDHGTGVVIGETTEIGNNVRLYQGVTLGALTFDRDDGGALVHGAYKRHPTLRDNVIVYANATILGGRTEVGESAVIGSNVWLTKSVEPFAVVVLDNPQHKVKGGKTRAAQEELIYHI